MCDDHPMKLEPLSIKSYYTINGSCLFILRVAQNVTPLGSLHIYKCDIWCICSPLPFNKVGAAF